jgi:ComF family protein
MTIDVPPSEISRWRAVARVLRSPLDALSCALLPASCTLCGSPLPQLSSAPICNACWHEFPAISGPCCACCGDTLDQPAALESPSLCRLCRMAAPKFVRAVSFGLYEGRMKQAIHALKYGRIHPAARRLGKMLATAIGQLASEAPAEMLVVPIPLHRAKRAERGFNQASRLAEQALAILRKTNPDWRLTLAPSALVRLRSTQSQAGLNPRKRRINMRGAFKVPDRAAVEGNDVLVIDDILTTGATARAAAQALMKAGARSVWMATLARARRYNTGASANVFGIRNNHESFGDAADAPTLQAREKTSSHDQPSF